MHGLVKCKHERRCSHASGADVSFRDVTIKIPGRDYDQGCEWRHALEAWADIWEKSVEFCRRKKKVDFRLLAEALRRVPHVIGGVDGKVSIERLSLSPYVEKPFHSKVIKSFVPELRSRQCFCVSGFLCYLYMCLMDIMNVLRASMSMYISHISLSWVCNTYVANAIICCCN